VALRTALVRTVRTASAEADRRIDVRVPVDVRCAIGVGEGARLTEGRLTDVGECQDSCRTEFVTTPVYPSPCFFTAC